MRSIKMVGFLFFFLFVVLSLDAYAMILSPEAVEKLRKEGKLQEWVGRWNSAAERGMYEITPDTPIRSKDKNFGDVDTLKPLAICVDFRDNEHTYTIGAFDTLLFSEDFVVPTGSFRDYYLENSYGQHDPQGGVYGWVEAPQTYDYYTWGASGLGSWPHNAQRLVYDVLLAVDPYMNFQDYDYDNDGWIDGLMVVHAGPGAEQTGDTSDIWSHRWSLPSIMTLDGVKMQSYTMQPEVDLYIGLIGIGVFCHEWGHFLGIHWEEYDSDYSSNGLGKWTVMAGGGNNNDGQTPSHHSAYCKYYLGWSDVNRLMSNQTNVEILQAETSPVSYRLWTAGGTGSQYFMVENRQRTGFDSSLPGSGLLIYHVDTSKPGNDWEWCPGSPATYHFKTAIEQADGWFQLEGCYDHGKNEGDASDPFPGYYGKFAFDDTTMPSSRDYYDDPTQVAVWNISESESVMYANMDVTWSRPCLFLDEFTLDDTTFGNGNGLPEPGETIRLYFTISNIWAILSNTTVTGSADTPDINFTDDKSYVGDIPTDGSVNNYSDPMEFEISSSFSNAVVTFTLHLEGEVSGEPYGYDLFAEAWVGRPDILIVDDDSARVKYNDFQSHYTSALDSLQRLYNVWDKEAQGDTIYDFSNYNILIWYTGDHREEIFSQADIESLMTFLDNGGRLFLTSQDAAEALSESGDPLDSVFLTDYLHCGLLDDSLNKYQVMGVPGDTIGDGFFIYLWGIESPKNQVSKDALVPDESAVAILNYANAGWYPATDTVAGLRYQGDYFKLVFFGFGFEGLSTAEQFQGEYLSRPHFIMQRVLEWLEGPLPTINVIYPNGGEGLIIEDTIDILWESISFDDSVSIQYSLDGGDDWLKIVDTTTNDGIYSWIVPDTLSDSCLIRVADVDNGVPADTSDTLFSIIDYVYGDANGDGIVDIGDVVYLINYLFTGTSPPEPMAAGDPNNDCIVDIGDVIYLINYLFTGTSPPQQGCA